MFPNDAITIRLDNNTANNNVNINVLPTGTYTILNVSFHSLSAESSSVSCGSVILVRHYATFNTEKFMSYLCDNATLTASLDNKTGALITYVPYDLSSVSPVIGSVSIDNASTFTSGDLFISLLLFIGLIIAIIMLAVKSIFGVAVHKKYLGVNQFEGKENYKI